VAARVGDPSDARRSPRCATNRVAIVVPCHRVVGARGSLTGYRWGVERSGNCWRQSVVAGPLRPRKRPGLA